MASTDLEKMNEPIPYRNLYAQVLIFIVTIGFYMIYWFYATARDFEKVVKREEPVVLWTLLLFVPLISFYAYYKYAELFEEVAPEYNHWLIIVLWVFFPPAVWLIVQMKLNRLAVEQGEATHS